MRNTIENLSVDYDHFAENPLLLDENITPVMFHKRYDLPNPLGLNHEDFNSWDELESHLKEKFKNVQKVYMYDHSGLAFRTEPFPDQWDSGVVGFLCSDDIEDMSQDLQMFEHYTNGSCYLIQVNEDMYTLYGFGEMIKDLEIEHECTDEEIKDLIKQL
jgi:hypothetical protein